MKMKKEELFDLADKDELEFNKISDLKLFLKDFLGPKLILPIVVGKKGSSRNLWDTFDAPPLTYATELTVMNYMEYLNCMERSRAHEEFNGLVYYGFLEHKSKDYLDSHILTALVHSARDEHLTQSFKIDFYFSCVDKLTGGINIGYQAASKIETTKLEESAKGFEGPNLDYRNVLI